MGLSMDRRTLLINMSLAFGCASTPLNSLAIDGALTYQSETKPQLAPDTLKTLSEVADIIIPQTNTPSASNAGVHLYIDYFVHHFQNEEERVQLLEGIDKMLGSSKQFLSLAVDKQIKLIQALDDALGSDRQNAAYKELKDLIIIAYFTSEVGAKQALNFDPVPGSYQEIKLKNLGRAWY